MTHDEFQQLNAVSYLDLQNHIMDTMYKGKYIIVYGNKNGIMDFFEGVCNCVFYDKEKGRFNAVMQGESPVIEKHRIWILHIAIKQLLPQQ